MATLAFHDLSVAGPDPIARLLDRITLTVGQSEILAVTGEVGCGAPLLGAAALGLLPARLRLVSGEILLDEEPIHALAPDRLHALRGKRLAAIPAGAGEALNPIQTIGAHLVETVLTHLRVSRQDATNRALFWLDRVGIGAPARIADSFPGELSKAVRQQAAIAVSLCAEPQLIVADEPTASLDLSAQARIFELLRALCREQGTAILLSTTRLAVVRALATRVAVLYAGRLVEIGRTQDVLLHPTHPYTQALVGAAPRLDRRVEVLPVRAGAMPDPGALPPGCPFHPRCPMAFDRCRTERPELGPASASGSSGETQASFAACLLYANPAAND